MRVFLHVCMCVCVCVCVCVHVYACVVCIGACLQVCGYVVFGYVQAFPRDGLDVVLLGKFLPSAYNYMYM